ncbi:uncharacterized protein [Diabrotica undecimpunctata]|uniref:uncharacterized protein n=1 Tax=Diabrotica undecimpunctata TaxID=50387 RepID=UPI003B63CCC8
MFKKIQKENGLTVESEISNLKENYHNNSEFVLSTLIGSQNIKKWNSIRIALGFKSNEEFVTKLLDLAQGYLDGLQKEEATTTEENKKTKKKHKPHKVKPSSSKKAQNDEFQQESDTVVNNSNVNLNFNVANIINDIVPEKTADNISKVKTDSVKQPKKVTKINEIDVNKKPTEKLQLPLKDLKICENKSPEEQPQVLPEKEAKPNNLDKIKIKLCHICNTHHVQEHCPISFPHYIINDSLEHSEWEEKFRVLHDIQYNKEKTELNEDDLTKYSYSMLSLPSCLNINETGTHHGLGIFAKSDLEPFAQFGPLVGNLIKERDISEDVNMQYIWEISEASGNKYIDTESNADSNWIKFVRPAPTRDDKNLTVIVRDSKLYVVSIKFIKNGEELLYWQDPPMANVKKKMEKTACGGCNMDFKHPQYYQIHCSIFHDLRYSLTIRKYHCKICGAAVLGKENIMKHATELHNGQGAYQCQFCKKYFLRLNYLEMHRTYGCSANPHRSKPLCDFCGRKFCQPQKLKVHIKRMHSDLAEVLKEFQCKSCLKILGSRAALQRHLKEVHKKQTEANCACSRCGKSFQNKSNLKIHMLTHSGIKPFKCNVTSCNSAFTTKQCLQFHYRKIHNYTEDNMPKIIRSIDYTFQAYSGNENENVSEDSKADDNYMSVDKEDQEEHSDDGSDNSENIDDPIPPQAPPQEEKQDEFPPPSPEIPTPPPEDYNKSVSGSNLKVLSKGSKKWIGDDPPVATKLSDIYSVEKLSKDDFSSITLQESEMYDRGKLTSSDFGRHEASNASLLVEAALDSVCNEPNIDIDGTPNCADSLVNNLYNLAQSDNLHDVSYNDQGCISDSRDISLISPSVNDHVSVTDELNDELRHDGSIGMHYSHFHQNDFSPPHSPDIHRSNFVRNYINSLSPQNGGYDPKSSSPVPSPSRYDLFGHHVNPDHLSSDDSNGMTVQNLSLHAKNEIQLDLSLYKTYKSTTHDYIRKFKLDDDIDVINNDLPSGVPNDEIKEIERDEHHDLSVEIRNKFDIDLDLRLKAYDSIDTESLRQRNHTYDTELDFRTKTYDLIDSVENRNKQYDLIESDFRTDRNFEPLILNSELQGLDMSARSFHNYSNVNRYRSLYPDVDRVDLRLNYSPPPPTYTHADLLRVVSLDLTPPGRHSVDLSLRNHPLHSIGSSRLLTDHSLQTTPHRLLDQSRLLNPDLISTRHLTTDRLIPETSNRVLTDHSTSRILNTEQLGTNHLLSSDQSRIIGDDSRVISDQSRLLDQSRLIGDGRILPPTTPSGAVSPVQGFSGYSVSQNPYHPASLTTRPHVTSPTSAAYHYPTYY